MNLLANSHSSLIFLTASQARTQIWLIFTTAQNSEWVYDKNVMEQKMLAVEDSENIFFFWLEADTEWWHSFGAFRPTLMEEKSWDRPHPPSSSCCIPHTRGNILVVLHHGGKVGGRQSWRHGDILLDGNECSGCWIYVCGLKYSCICTHKKSEVTADNKEVRD